MRLIKYSTPLQDQQAVCMTQSTSEPGDLTINGTVANPCNGIASFGGFAMQLGIASIANNSGVTFTIYGFNVDQAISETITGPNNGEVYSTNFYTTITRISASDEVVDLSVGTGQLVVLVLSPFGQPFTLSVASANPALNIDSIVLDSLDEIDISSITVVNGQITVPKNITIVGATDNEPLLTYSSDNVLNNLIIPVLLSANNSANITLYVNN